MEGKIECKMLLLSKKLVGFSDCYHCLLLDSRFPRQQALSPEGHFQKQKLRYLEFVVTVLQQHHDTLTAAKWNQSDQHDTQHKDDSQPASQLIFATLFGSIPQSRPPLRTARVIGPSSNVKNAGLCLLPTQSHLPLSVSLSPFPSL